MFQHVLLTTINSSLFLSLICVLVRTVLFFLTVFSLRVVLVEDSKKWSREEEDMFVCFFPRGIIL